MDYSGSSEPAHGGDSMTGRDVPTRQKAQAVFFSVIMVLSMVAIGGAMFAGSAAASPADASDFSGFVAANPADANANAGNSNASTHTITANITTSAGAGADLAGGADDTTGGIIIEYDDAANIDPSGIGAANVDIDLISADGSTVTTIGVESTGTLANSEPVQAGGDGPSSSGQILIVVEGGNTDLDGSQSVGDQVRVTISGIDHNGLSDTAVDVGLTSQDLGSSQDISNAEEVANLNLNIGGPIDFNGEETYYSLQAALDAVSSDGQYVNVSENQGELDETYTQPNALGATDGFSDVQIDNNVEIVGGDGTQIEYPDSSANSGAIIRDNDGEEITVTNLAVSGDGFIDDKGQVLFSVSSGSTDLTIQDSTFDTFDTKVVEANGLNSLTVENTDFDGDTADDYIGVDVTDTAGDVDIGASGAGNTFANVSDGTGIQVAMGSNDFANITANTIGIENGNGIDIDTQGNNPTVDLTDNDVVSDTSSGNGVVVNSNNADTDATVDISGGSIDNVTDAVDAADDATQFEGQYLNVTGVEMTNLQGGSSNGITVTETTAGNLDTLVVDDVTIEGDSQTTGVNTDAQANADVLNSVINNTDIGVDAQGSDAHFNVSNTEITNSNTHAVQISDSGSNTGTFRVDQDTSIDQAGSQGIEIATLDDNDDAVEVDNVAINGTDIGIRYNDGSNTPDINVTNSEITNAGTAGLQLNDNGGDGTQIRAHFNTISDNEVGIETATDFQSNDGVSLTFNDIVDNNANGYEDSTGQGNMQVNANYSWWDNPHYSRIVGPYTPQNAVSQPPIPRRVYSYTRLHTEGQL